MLQYKFDEGHPVGIKSELKELWLKKIFEVLKYVLNFCDENNIRYYGCAGTVIGAVRHKGIIPWDDDIDLMMPRKDYETFIRKFSAIKDCPYGIVTPDVDSDYYLMFTKVFYKRSTLLERKDLRYIIGPFVDVFPIDGCPGDPKIAESIFNKYRMYIDRWNLSVQYWGGQEYVYNFRTLQWRYLLRHALCHLFKRQVKKHVLKKLRSIERMYAYDDSQFVITWCGQNSFNREWHERSWLGDGIKVKFEDVDLNIPTNYDAYLKCMYGDYMELPPEEDRASHHYVAYLNMNERETLKEVLQKIRK